MSFVAFLVAADRDWLCHSFLVKYQDFESTAREPGRQFGQPFLEKVFDLEARLPTIPVALAASIPTDTMSEAADKKIEAEFENANNEGDVRELVRQAETASQSLRQDYRIQAVKRLGAIEYGKAKKGSPDVAVGR